MVRFRSVRVHIGRSAVKTQDQGDMGPGKEEKDRQLPVFCQRGKKVESFSLHSLILVLLRLADCCRLVAVCGIIWTDGGQSCCLSC
jgi:hypothetical protein